MKNRSQQPKFEAVHADLWVLYNQKEKGYMVITDNQNRLIDTTQNLNNAEFFKSKELADSFSTGLSANYNYDAKPLKIYCSI